MLDWRSCVSGVHAPSDAVFGAGVSCPHPSPPQLDPDLPDLRTVVDIQEPMMYMGVF